MASQLICNKRFQSF